MCCLPKRPRLCMDLLTLVHSREGANGYGACGDAMRHILFGGGHVVSCLAKPRFSERPRGDARSSAMLFHVSRGRRCRMWGRLGGVARSFGHVGNAAAAPRSASGSANAARRRRRLPRTANAVCRCERRVGQRMPSAPPACTALAPPLAIARRAGQTAFAVRGKRHSRGARGGPDLRKSGPPPSLHPPLVHPPPSIHPWLTRQTQHKRSTHFFVLVKGGGDLI